MSLTGVFYSAHDGYGYGGRGGGGGEVGKETEEQGNIRSLPPGGGEVGKETEELPTGKWKWERRRRNRGI
jgi:hypothetical protein